MQVRVHLIIQRTLNKIKAPRLRTNSNGIYWGEYLLRDEVRQLREEVAHVRERGLEARELVVARLHVAQHAPRLRRLRLHVVHEQRDVVRVQQRLALLLRHRQVRCNVTE